MTQPPPDMAAPATFETAFERLDAVVRELETGGLTVDQSVRLYEEGMALARLCNQRLDAAELTVATLQADAERLDLAPALAVDDGPDDH